MHDFFTHSIVRWMPKCWLRRSMSKKFKLEFVTSALSQAYDSGVDIELYRFETLGDRELAVVPDLE